MLNDDEYSSRTGYAGSGWWPTPMVVWNTLLTVLVAYLLATSFYEMTISVSSSPSYSNHHLQSDITSTRRDLRRLNHTVHQLLACASCVDDVLLISNSNTSGAVYVKNSSAADEYFSLVPYVVSQGETLLLVQQNVSQLFSLVEALENSTSLPLDALRLQITDLQPLAEHLPNGTSVPFLLSGIYTYRVDMYGVFDISNSSHVTVNHRALIQSDVNIFFAGNGSSPEAICMLFPDSSMLPFQAPPLVAGSAEGVNVTAFGAPFEQVGTIDTGGSFIAEAGWQLTVMCSIAQDFVFALVPSSHIEFTVISLDV